MGGGTIVGKTLDRLPVHYFNRFADRAAQLVGFKQVGNWRRKGIGLLESVVAEVCGTLRRGLEPIPANAVPAFLQGLPLGTGGINAGIVEWKSESAFGIGAAIGKMLASDRMNPDSIEILELLTPVDRGVEGFTIDETRTAHIAKLSIGAPGVAPPQAITDKEIEFLSTKNEAVRKGLYAYITGAGTPETLAAISKRYSETFGIGIVPEQVAEFASCKDVINKAVKVFINRGEEVGYMSPYFPMHDSVPQLQERGGVTWNPQINLGKFSYRLEDLKRIIKQHPRMKMLILSYPGNPAPFMFTEKELHDIVELCYQNRIRIYVDAPYFEVMYPGSTYPNIFKAHLKAREIVVMALSESKGLAMPGRRIGFAIGSEGVLRAMTRVMINENSCPNVFNDLLLRWIYTDGFEKLQTWKAEQAVIYGRKAEHAFQQLSALSGVLEVEKPKGGFYMFPIFTEEFMNCAGMKELAKKGLPGIRGLAIYLMLAYKTVTIPGTSFAKEGTVEGDRGLRFSIAGEETNDVRLGTARFCRCIRDLQTGKVFNIPQKYSQLVPELMAVL